MRSSLQVSYNLLKPSLQRKLCRLAAFPASFDRPAAAAVWKVSAEAAQMVLDALLRSSWLVFDPQTGRFHLHTQVRSFLDEQLSDATRKQAFTRHARYYLDVVTAANQRFAQRGENMLQGLRQLDAEWPNIQAGQAWAARQADQDENAAGLCARYPDAASQILPMRLSSTEWIAWLEPALKAAQRANQPELAGSHLGNLGNACMALERYDEAIPHYKSALDIARPAKNRRGEASSLNGLGRAYQMLAQYDEAVKCYQRALEIEQSIHDQRGEGVTLGNLGNVHQALKQYDQAKKDYEQALAIAKDTGDRLGEARRLENLAGVYRKQGDLTGARHLRQQALAIYEDLSGLPESEAGAGN